MQEILFIQGVTDKIVFGHDVNTSTLLVPNITFKAHCIFLEKGPLSSLRMFGNIILCSTSERYKVA